jgi:hypothetical protein
MMTTAFTRFLAAVALAVVATTAIPASATTGTISGMVNRIKVQDDSVGDSWFTLSSATTVGQCLKNGTTPNTLILFPNNDRGKQMLSTVQAAWLAGKTMTVQLDDGNTGSDVYCYAKWLTVP